MTRGHFAVFLCNIGIDESTRSRVKWNVQLKKTVTKTVGDGFATESRRLLRAGAERFPLTHHFRVGDLSGVCRVGFPVKAA